MAKLSIIVPVYNAEDYLDFCLDSLRIQTLSDIEVVCVNDGSTDSSRQIATAYAEKDSRFVLVDKQNGGPSSARNLGINTASAPFVCFVDSDDSLKPDACEKILAAFERTGADVITFGASFYPASAGNAWLIKHLSPRDVEYEGFSPDLVFKEMSHPFACRTACRKDFLLRDKLFFDEAVTLGEDELFHFMIYPRSRKTVLMSDKLYEYRLSREDSLMHSQSADATKKIREHIKVIRKVFASWAQGGFLSRCPAEMIEWTVGFALYDSAHQPRTVRDALLDDLRNIWLEHFSKDEILGLQLPRASRNMVRTALIKPEAFEGFRGKLLRHFSTLHLFGVRYEANEFFSRWRQ